MYELYLCHHGVKGQKWGVRRYQNEDGSLTSRGQSLYEREMDAKRKQTKKGKTVEPLSRVELKSAINKQVGDDMNNFKDVTRSSSKVAESLSGINRSISSSRKRKAAEEMDLSKMSNKELQDAVNRMNLERTYRSLKTSDATRGQEQINDILTIGGAALGAASSAIGIAVSIHMLKSGSYK